MKNDKNIYAKGSLFAALSSVIISLLFFYLRFDFHFDAPLKNWIDTATYFNNLLSPIFLFITIFLLYLTWKDTKLGLEQQNYDNNFHILMDSTSTYLDDLKRKLNKQISDEDEVPIISCVEALNVYYDSFVTDILADNDVCTETYNLLANCDVNFNVSATYLFQQYRQISDERHKTAYKLNLYGTLDKHVFNVMIFFKIGVLEFTFFKHDKPAIEAEIEFLKDVALIAHENEYLKIKPYDKKKLKDFCELFN
ncbi:hypothetical protein [Pseudoalteromonas sp. CH_XMU1449-3]|uniref:hypothetical protein n=1 Tax=Pseudoalteromonas sp. CH_XMU1449-3 TaxID=3107774 RepID=UPI00300AECEC